MAGTPIRSMIDCGSKYFMNTASQKPDGIMFCFIYRELMVQI